MSGHLQEEDEVAALMTMGEVADFLGLHPNTVWKMAKDGRLPSVKLGRSRRFLRDEILAHLHGAATAA